MDVNSRLAVLAARYERRQGRMHIFREYEPAIQAVRGEAPSISRCSRIVAPRLGRRVHALSRTEAEAMLFALYCPELVDMQEQRCLPLDSSRHPVSPYSTDPAQLALLPGSVPTADQLGLIRFHPRFVDGPADARYHVPLQIVGDILLILCDKAGIYAMNWNVKRDENGFHERLGAKPLRRGSRRNEEKAKALFEIERTCYAKAGIPTRGVVSGSFDKNLIINLSHYHASYFQRTELSEDVQRAMIEAFRGILNSGCTPFDLSLRLCREFRCALGDCLTVFRQAIWNRRLLVDLFRPVVSTAPIHAETISPFERYAKFFAREYLE